jgi:penicillin-binding protein 2
VDARGREVNQTEDLRILQKSATVDPLQGLVLKSTLDFKTQVLAAKLFENKKGALVAMDPRTGEIISLYSSPGFDANRITKNIDKKYLSHINLHEDKILFNRTIQAMYPPASTYKIVTLTAGIESGVIDPEKTSFNCSGGLRFGNRFFKCWRSGGHGRVNTIRALGQSCDVFFYQLGLLVGVDGLAKYAKMFGLNASTGIEIPFEKSGLIPSKEWKKKRYNQDWIESETLSIAIGQSYDLVTPLQNVVVASIVANGGYTIKPHLGKALLDAEGNVVREIKHEKTATELVASKALEWVKKGMIEVVHGQGTAVRLKQSPFKIAGKTGTAQVISHGSKGIKGQSTEAHALFVAFAPYDDPKIAVSVIVEHGRGGSVAAAPIAMQVIDTYLGGL